VKKDIISWFKPHDRQHLKAYVVLRHTGIWPEGFIPDDVEFPYNWHLRLTAKIADLYVDEKMAEWTGGKHETDI